MNYMEVFLEIAKLVIPSGVVFLTAYLVIKRFMEAEQSKRVDEIRKSKQTTTIPIRLQAYERLAMFLERMDPGSIIHRVHREGMSAKMLQAQLLNAIRSEFEHNLSQQVYISHDAWELIKEAKGQMIELVNIAGSKVSENASGIDLSKVILDMKDHLDTLPTTVALNFLKQEIRSNF